MLQSYRDFVALCVRKFLQFGLEAALGELPRPGKSRRIPDDAIAWVQHCACEKPKELGYSHELWTYSLLQEHVRKHCLDAGHPSLTELSRSRLHRILTQGEIRPHKIRYYVERRDPEFEAGMAGVLSGPIRNLVSVLSDVAEKRRQTDGGSAA